MNYMSLGILIGVSSAIPIIAILGVYIKVLKNRSKATEDYFKYLDTLYPKVHEKMLTSPNIDVGRIHEKG